jgi:flagellar assembly factor FliW
MHAFETKLLGEISYEDDAVIEFPHGLPGFDEFRRFVAVTLEHTNPLVFLQSVEDAALCFTTLPVLSVDPCYRLSLSGEDRDLVDLPAGRQPVIGREVLCLAVLSIRETGATANLLAPVVVNPRNLKAVQAVAQESGYSHQHVLTVTEEETEEVALCS